MFEILKKPIRRKMCHNLSRHFVRRQWQLTARSEIELRCPILIQLYQQNEPNITIGGEQFGSQAI